MRGAILIIVFLIGIAAYFLLGEDGWLDQVNEHRIEQALVDNGVPANMSECMAPRLVDRLSNEQLRKLERFAPEGDETALPTSTGEAMARLRRVDDRDAVEQVVIVAGGCGIDLIREAF